MPGVTQYIADPNSRTNAFRKQEGLARQELNARVARINRNRDYYNGKHRKHLADDGTNTDDNVTFNLNGLTVNKGAADIVGTSEDGVIAGPKFDVVGRDMPRPSIVRQIGRIFRPSADKSPEQLWLDGALAANNKELFLLNTATESGIAGHNFIKVIPDALPNMDDESKPYPRLIRLNSSHVQAFWDEGDKDKVLAYRIQYGTEGSAKRQEIVWEETPESTNEDGVHADASGSWVIYDWEQRDNRRTWVLTKTLPWEYNWPPIVQWQNMPDPNDFYGREDVEESALKLNDNLNFTASNVQRIIKHHARPKTIGTGIDEEENKLQASAIDTLWTTPNDKANFYNLEMQSDLTSSMNYAKMLRRGYFDQVQELDPATVEDRLGDLTNFALRVLYGDKVRKAGTKRMMAGMGLTDICQHILELGGFGAGIKIAIKWPAILPDDPIVETQALDMDTKHGVSQESYLEKRGYDSELEMMRREREQAEMLTAEVTSRQSAPLDALRARNGTNGNVR
jgi:hypothetical protein